MEEYTMPKRNSNSRPAKTVSFNPKPPQVLIIEGRDIVPPEPGSVRDRVQKYNNKIMQCSIPQQPRLPALPPRNSVQSAVARSAITKQPSSSSPPQPPPRARNYLLTACQQQIRSFRRERNTQPDCGGTTRRYDAAVLPGRVFVPPDLHLRMKVPDTPPPPPPPLPSVPSVDKNDGKRRGHRKHTNPVQEQADRTDDGNNDSGCFSGCLYFTVGCIGCIIG